MNGAFGNPPSASGAFSDEKGQSGREAVPDLAAGSAPNARTCTGGTSKAGPRRPEASPGGRQGRGTELASVVMLSLANLADHGCITGRCTLSFV